MALRYRKIATVAFVAIMIASTGCVGGLTDSGTSTPSPESNSSDSQSTPDSQPDYVNVTEFRMNTVSSLEESDSYNATVSETTQSASEERNLTADRNSTYLLDSENNRTLITTESTLTGSTGPIERESATYVEGEVQYSQLNNESGTYYDAFNYSDSNLSPNTSPTISAVSDPLLVITLFDGWVEQESTSYDGVSMTRYTGTQVADSEETDVRVNVTNGSADIYVNSEGEVRIIEANFTYQTQVSNNPVSTNVIYSISNIDSTTVEEPEWISEAPEPQSVEEQLSTESEQTPDSDG